MVVHWGDTTTSNITSYNQAETLHTYPSAGTYTINIYREVKGWYFNAGGDRLKMGAISNWGGFNVTNADRSGRRFEALVLRSPRRDESDDCRLVVPEYVLTIPMFAQARTTV